LIRSIFPEGRPHLFQYRLQLRIGNFDDVPARALSHLEVGQDLASLIRPDLLEQPFQRIRVEVRRYGGAICCREPECPVWRFQPQGVASGTVTSAPCRCSHAEE
jgi:hypothetical protein